MFFRWGSAGNGEARADDLGDQVGGGARLGELGEGADDRGRAVRDQGLRRIGGGDGNGGHAGGVGGLDAGDGVLENDAGCGRQAEALGCQEIDFGIGLAVRDM